MSKFSRTTLVLIAGLLWLAAGIGVLSVGIGALGSSQSVLGAAMSLLGAAPTFAVFYKGVFSKMAKKNETRLMGFESRAGIQRVLDPRGWAVMAFMMTLGAVVRLSGIAPQWFFAFFYTGLGCALALAGAMQLARRVCATCGGSCCGDGHATAKNN